MKTFDSWPEAFDYCRDLDSPVVATVNGKTLKIFPSGSTRTVKLTTKKTETALPRLNPEDAKKLLQKMI